MHCASCAAWHFVLNPRWWSTPLNSMNMTITCSNVVTTCFIRFLSLQGFRKCIVCMYWGFCIWKRSCSDRKLRPQTNLICHGVFLDLAVVLYSAHFNYVLFVHHPCILLLLGFVTFATTASMNWNGFRTLSLFYVKPIVLFLPQLTSPSRATFHTLFSLVDPWHVALT